MPSREGWPISALLSPRRRPRKLFRPIWSINDEASTFLLLDRLAAKGIATALPVMQGRGAPLGFRLWKKDEPLGEAKWGIKEPFPAAEVFPDLLFVPLAGFDRAGNRLGYGAGFYDRTFARLRALQPILPSASLMLVRSCRPFRPKPTIRSSITCSPIVNGSSAHEFGPSMPAHYAATKGEPGPLNASSLHR